MPTIPSDSLNVDSILNVVSEIKDICSQQPPNNAFDWFSLLASAATLICFIITIWQLHQVNSTNKQVKLALEANQSRIEQSLTLITVTDAKRIADMVLLLIDGGQYMSALVRMQDLNSATIQLKKKHPSLGRIQMLLPSEIEHLTDIKDSIIKEETSIFKVSDTRHVIQRLHDALSEIDSELKSQTINSKQ